MIVAVGDVHGQAESLDTLLRRLRLKSGDTLVLLGDLVDRGPDSRGVVERLLAFRTGAECVLLMGNHEEMALDARDAFDPDRVTEDVRLWLSQGGKETVASYGLDLETCSDEEYACWPRAIPEEHWGFLGSGEDELVVGDWLFVHAGLLPPGRDWDLEMVALGLEPRRWIREEFLTYPARIRGRRVVYGHTPTKDGLPSVRPEKLGLDTGAAYGGPLTAARLGGDGEVLGFLQALGDDVRELDAEGNPL